jgi:hypothetical protein
MSGNESTLQTLWNAQDLENYAPYGYLRDALDGRISVDDLRRHVDHWRAIEVSVWRQNGWRGDEWHAQKRRRLTWLADVVRACGGEVFYETFT